MALIDVAAYWPFFTTKELRRFDYVSVDGSVAPITSVFSYDVGSQSMLLNDYDEHGVWKDRWYYQSRPGFGVAEWRDDYPNGKKIVMTPPIGWGDKQEIGGTYINYPRMDLLRCWPPAWSKGCQIVAYEELMPLFETSYGEYRDVLRFTYQQAWDGKPSTGARYWMAKGIGPVALQWMAQDPKDPSRPLITTSRLDAKISTVW